MIPYGKHSIGTEELSAIESLMNGGWLTQGPKVDEFESAFSEFCNVKYCCAVNSATSALHIAYLSLGVKYKSIVWTSANTFVATSNAAIMCRATVDFVDISLESGNICINALKEKLKKAEHDGVLPDVVTVVHYAGAIVDMKKIKALSDMYGFKVVEDASHAVGSIGLEREKVGSCRYSDIAVFSFHPVKIMTTAEGGMLTTNSESNLSRFKSLRSHGIDKDLNSRGNTWEFDQVELGYNYRMSDLQAVIGIEQLKKVDDFIKARRKIASFYDDQFSGVNLSVVKPDENTLSSYHLYPILLCQTTRYDNKINIFKELRDLGVGVNVHYKPVYLNTYYTKYGFKPRYCPNAEEFYLRELSLPIFPTLSIENQKIVITSVKQVLENLS